jgi:catechol 2,3-dioxygenase-like lactoylglutathione lyase family enzyme
MAEKTTFHVSLYVADIERAVGEYRKILGIEPAKVRPGYAKFEIAEPPVILSLNLGGTPGELSHLGIRYGSTGEVASEMARAKSKGLEMLQEPGVTCCYAKADKFWVRDGDGVAWEMYTVLEDVEVPTAAEPGLRRFLGQGDAEPAPAAAAQPACGTDAPAPRATGCC